MICATEVAQAREQSSWEHLQWAQEGKLKKGTISFSKREELGAQVPEKQNWDLQLGTVTLARAAVAQSPFWPHSC